MAYRRVVVTVPLGAADAGVTVPARVAMAVVIVRTVDLMCSRMDVASLV